MFKKKKNISKIIGIFKVKRTIQGEKRKQQDCIIYLINIAYIEISTVWQFQIYSSLFLLSTETHTKCKNAMYTKEKSK